MGHSVSSLDLDRYNIYMTYSKSIMRLFYQANSQVTFHILPKLEYTYSNQIKYNKTFKQAQNLKTYPCSYFADDEFPSSKEYYPKIISYSDDYGITRRCGKICKCYIGDDEHIIKIIWVEGKKMFVFSFIDMKIYLIPIKSQLHSIRFDDSVGSLQIIIPGFKKVNCDINQQSIQYRKGKYKYKTYKQTINSIKINQYNFKNGDLCDIYHENKWFMGLVLWIDNNKIFVLSKSGPLKIFILSNKSIQITPIGLYSNSLYHNGKIYTDEVKENFTDEESSSEDNEEEESSSESDDEEEES